MAPTCVAIHGRSVWARHAPEVVVVVAVARGAAAMTPRVSAGATARQQAVPRVCLRPASRVATGRLRGGVYKRLRRGQLSCSASSLSSSSES